MLSRLTRSESMSECLSTRTESPPSQSPSAPDGSTAMEKGVPLAVGILNEFILLELVFGSSVAKVDPGLGLLRNRSADDGTLSNDAVNSATPIAFCIPAQRLLPQCGGIHTPLLIGWLLRSELRPQSIRTPRRSPLSAHRTTARIKNH